MLIPMQTHYGLRGVAKQWGKTVGGGSQTVSLPISFDVAFTAVATAGSHWCNPGCVLTNTSITTTAYQSNRPEVAQPDPVFWIACGSA